MLLTVQFVKRIVEILQPSDIQLGFEMENIGTDEPITQELPTICRITEPVMECCRVSAIAYLDRE